MKTATFTRSLGLGVTAALVATAFPFTAASAAAPYTLTALSVDGDTFQPSEYDAKDITVQVKDAAGDVDVDDAQDLTYSWSVTPLGGGSAVRFPTSGDATQATDTAGSFDVDLPKAGAGTYTLSAGLTATATGGDGVAATALRTFTVGEGSTAVVTALSTGKPGVAQSGTVTVQDADGKAYDEQLVTLSLDHGFFTPATSKAPNGSRAGDLEDDGATLTVTTDSKGTVDFSVGIARDAGFDDDAKVDSTVTVAGAKTSGTAAAWSTANPLNGQVAVRLAPASVQDGPVAPTLAGNRTFYDAFALDQFGNPVDGAELELSYPGSLNVDSDRDGAVNTYDVVSGLGSFGAIELTLYRAGFVDVTGTWADAPSTIVGGTTTIGSTPASGSLRSTTYEIQFNGSRYSMGSSVSDTVRVGTPVTQTVRAVDQQGNPIEGFQVRFLRYGPDDVRGDVVATRTTNALGEATYTFIGTRPGRSTITAEISDGNRRRELSNSVAFGKVVRAKLVRTKGSASGRGKDRLTVTTRAAAPGARVQVYSVVKGKQRLVASKKLDRKGVAKFSVRDRNRSRSTVYVAEVRSTSKTIADRSNSARLR
ncbi:Ig-like domain-containing protein [Aeromicrobium sp. Root472D3]|uniref:Ig-like domain-containing protein n=1 Tax=Aeromicrobium sp. Root472D3 TaxID=1736540 RepID=UPI000AF2CC96|nr:Ig-like domain-containing protein [Aeromicrobium sp. Root472D3]